MNYKFLGDFIKQHAVVQEWTSFRNKNKSVFRLGFIMWVPLSLYFYNHLPDKPSYHAPFPFAQESETMGTAWLIRIFVHSGFRMPFRKTTIFLMGVVFCTFVTLAYHLVFVSNDHIHKNGLSLKSILEFSSKHTHKKTHASPETNNLDISSQLCRGNGIKPEFPKSTKVLSHLDFRKVNINIIFFAHLGETLEMAVKMIFVIAYLPFFISCKRQ